MVSTSRSSQHEPGGDSASQLTILSSSFRPSGSSWDITSTACSRSPSLELRVSKQMNNRRTRRHERRGLNEELISAYFSTTKTRTHAFSSSSRTSIARKLKERIKSHVKGLSQVPCQQGRSEEGRGGRGRSRCSKTTRRELMAFLHLTASVSARPRLRVGRRRSQH